jgi:hypothetical protein
MNENIVTPLKGAWANPYTELQLMRDELEKVVYSYSGRVSLAATLGVLEILKQDLLEASK